MAFREVRDDLPSRFLARAPGKMSLPLAEVGEEGGEYV